MILHHSDVRSGDIRNAGGNVPLDKRDAATVSFDPMSDDTDIALGYLELHPEEGPSSWSLEQIMSARDRVTKSVHDDSDPTLDCCVDVTVSKSHYAEMFSLAPLPGFDAERWLHWLKDADRRLIEAALEEDMTITTVDPDGPYVGLRVTIDGVTIPLATLLGHRNYTCPRMDQRSTP